MPFDAVTAFFDPAVQFGLQFETIETAAEDDAAVEATEEPPSQSNGKPKRKGKCRGRSGAGTPTPEHPQRGGGEVVRLDRFRKK